MRRKKNRILLLLFCITFSPLTSANNSICHVWGNYEYYKILSQTNSVHRTDSLCRDIILQMQVCGKDTFFSTPISIGGFSPIDILYSINIIDSTNAILNTDNNSMSLEYIGLTTIHDAYCFAKNYYTHRWFCGEYNVTEMGSEYVFTVQFTDDGYIVKDDSVVYTYGLDADVAGQDYIWVRDCVSLSLSFFLIYKEEDSFRLYISEVIDVADSIFPKGNLMYTLIKL